MPQKRKQRIITYTVEIVCFTDFMQQTLTTIFELCIKAMLRHETEKGHRTEITFDKTVEFLKDQKKK